MKEVTLTHSGQTMNIDLADVVPSKSLVCQIWEGHDETGEPVKFVVCGYVLTEKNLPEMPGLAPDEAL